MSSVFHHKYLNGCSTFYKRNEMMKYLSASNHSPCLLGRTFSHQPRCTLAPRECKPPIEMLLVTKRMWAWWLSWLLSLLSFGDNSVEIACAASVPVGSRTKADHAVSAFPIRAARKMGREQKGRRSGVKGTFFPHPYPASSALLPSSHFLRSPNEKKLLRACYAGYCGNGNHV